MVGNANGPCGPPPGTTQIGSSQEMGTLTRAHQQVIFPRPGTVRPPNGVFWATASDPYCSMLHTWYPAALPRQTIRVGPLAHRATG